MANGKPTLNVDSPENYSLGEFDMRSIEEDMSRFIDAAGAQDMKDNKQYWVDKMTNGLLNAVNNLPNFDGNTEND